MKCILIGAGNVATHYAGAMERKGMTVSQVYSRTEEHARALGQKLDCQWTTDLGRIAPDGDVYIFAVRDNALRDTIMDMPVSGERGIWIHTSGSVPMEVFKGRAGRYGVIYPLQTISRDHAVDFSKVHFFIEANTKETEETLFRIAAEMADCCGENVHPMSSEDRKFLHLAAVFANNFTNHMFALAYSIMREHCIRWDLMMPLIEETVGKIKEMPPYEAQTGPALRMDTGLIEKHLGSIEDEQVRKVYRAVTGSIYRQAEGRTQISRKGEDGVDGRHNGTTKSTAQQ